MAAAKVKKDQASESKIVKLAEKRSKGRPKVYEMERVRSHYWVPVTTKDKMARIAEKLGLTMTETFVLLVDEEYNKVKGQ